VGNENKQSEPENESHQIAGKVLMQWNAPEYVQHERGNDWYWWLGLIAVVLLVFAVWQKSFLFGVLIILGWFTTILFAMRQPKNVHFIISEQGITIDSTFYSWGSIKSFWIFNNPPIQKELSLVSERTLSPYVKIPLGDVDPNQVHEILKKHVEEIEQEESIIEHLAHLFKF
jgi:hypothetical protein